MSSRPHPFETLLTALAGWLPLLGGLTLLAMTLITPEWLGWRELLWQRDMLRLQAESLQTQRAGYAAFYDTLLADDPVLLERLAYTHLRYKPTGKHLMEDMRFTAGSGYPNGEIGLVANTARSSPGADHTGLRAMAVTDEVVESWLATPQPVVGKDIQPLRPINSRLTRLTSGIKRYVLLSAAILCLIAGLWPERPEPQRESPEPTDSPPASEPEPRPPLGYWSV